MKKAVKLVLVYLLMQVLGMLTALPFAMLYIYMVYGELDSGLVNTLSLAPSMLFSMLYMGVYLWKRENLESDSRLFRLPPVSVVFWILLAWISGVVLTNVLVGEFLSLPDWMKVTFEVLETGWLGIFCITLLGPVIEELLCRGVITRELLRSYQPAWAVFFSGLLFGVLHLNPAQAVPAMFMGFLLAWFYYLTRSVVPGMICHILNNSVSVLISVFLPQWADAKCSELMGIPFTVGVSVVAFLLLSLSVWRIRHCRLV